MAIVTIGIDLPYGKFFRRMAWEKVARLLFRIAAGRRRFYLSHHLA